jgi:indolepyruvate ferredoxin oxidoreductase alpha subunit
MRDMMVPGRFVFAYGVFYPDGPKLAAKFDAKHIVFAGRSETMYDFERPDWWIRQIDQLGRFYVNAEFGDGPIDYRNYRTNLSSSGVTGGAMVIVGEDYGEGSSIMQERSHPFAMKAQMWLLDPRPNLPSIVKMVSDGFDLSEASNTPVMLMVRIRSCHVTGSFTSRDNQRPKLTVREAVANPRSDFARVVLPPMSYAHEQDKVKNRWPAAEKFIVDRGLNEFFGPKDANFGIVVQGGMYNGVIRALQRLGLADIYGNTDVPLYVLNVTYPLISSQFLQFCEGKDHVLVVEEGQPEFIETQLGSYLYRAGSGVKLHGKGLFPMAGEYTGVVMLDAMESFIRTAAPQMLPAAVRAPNMELPAIPDLSKTVPIRPPGFCTGCPERPIFAAMKLVERELGKHQIAADIGCHLFASLPPFEIGGATMGYGLGPAANGAFDGGGDKRHGFGAGLAGGLRGLV